MIKYETQKSVASGCFMLWIQLVLQNNCPKYNSNLNNDFVYFNCLLTVIQVSTRHFMSVSLLLETI